jgi:uncharacterized protein (DUF885 family)
MGGPCGETNGEFDPNVPRAGMSAFRSYLDADWTAWLDLYPELATYFGYPGYNDRLTDDSTEGIARRRRHLESSLAKLRTFRREELESRERLDFDQYLSLLEGGVEGLGYGDDPLPFHFGMPHSLWMPISQMEGIHLTAADLLAMQPRQTVRELEDIVARLRALPKEIDNNIALLEAGRAHGYTPSKTAIHGVPDQVHGLIVDDPIKSPILEAFQTAPTTIAPSEWTRLAGEAARAYSQGVRPALQRLHQYLVSTYLPACRETFGISAVPQGAAIYQRLIHWQTTTTLTAQQIHQIGLAELDRIHQEMEKVRVAAGFTGTLPEFYEYLRTEPTFFFRSGDELIQGYRALGKRADAGLARLFGRLPRLPYGVEPMPAYKAASSPAAYYQPGAPADGRPGLFYANTHHLDSRPHWEMEDLLLHEAVPGHHLQIAISDELEGVPSFRRHSGYTAFVEGWGLYAETLGEELGFYGDPLSKMGQLIADAWRSVRLVVDTGIHAMGWSRDQAIRFFSENAGRSNSDITVEVDRYIVWPGQALGYKIGQLKFRELRTRAETALGAKFDVRRFHDLLLGAGAVPLAIVESRVDAWIAGGGQGAG